MLRLLLRMGLLCTYQRCWHDVQGATHNHLQILSLKSLHRTCRNAEKSDDQAQAVPPGHGFSCRAPLRCALSTIPPSPTSLAANCYGRVRSFLA